MVGHISQRQIGQMASQIDGHFARISVSIGGIVGEALVQNIFKPTTYAGVCPAKLHARLCCVGRRQAAGKRFIKHDRERIDIGSAVDAVRDRQASPDSIHRRALLGRRVTRSAADARRFLPPEPFYIASQMEIEQHRLTVGGQKNVRRFHVQMRQATLMGIVQRIRETSANPANRIDVFRPRKESKGRSGFAKRRVFLTPRIDQLFGNMSDAAIGDPTLSKPLQDRMPRLTSQIRHAQCSQAGTRKILHEIERHDMGVLQAGQREVFVPAPSC